jgi:hypothetical protein
MRNADYCDYDIFDSARLVAVEIGKLPDDDFLSFDAIQERGGPAVADLLVGAGLTPALRTAVFVELDERPGQFPGYSCPTEEHPEWHWKLRRVRNSYPALFTALKEG